MTLSVTVPQNGLGLHAWFDCILILDGKEQQPKPEVATLARNGVPMLRFTEFSADLVSQGAIDQKRFLTAQLRKAGYRRPLLWVGSAAWIAVARRFNEVFRIVDLDQFSLSEAPDAALVADLCLASGAHAKLLQATALPEVALTVTDQAAPNELLDTIANMAERRLSGKKKILVLYDHFACHTATVREYLESFRRYSENEIVYAVVANDAPDVFPIDAFDIVVFHYSVRLSLEQHLPEHYARQIEAFLGPKFAFLQDEYETTGTAKAWLRRLGIDVLFTCVPDAYHEAVYPKSELPGLKLVTVLTGAVPEALQHVRNWVDIAERKTLIGYRGRELPFWYGKLGREKLEIGVRVKAEAVARGLPVNIEWEDDKRIYGNAWFDFIMSCRAVLGTESGANVFDEDGSLKRSIQRVQSEKPQTTFEEIHARFMAQEEGRVMMNQVSPKIFEAIAFRTAMVLFEGEYSGVVRPWDHYIPLKKDYSNLDEVFSKLEDIEFLRAMTERAFCDVIESGRYSYEAFVKQFDRVARDFPALISKNILVACFAAEQEGGKTRSFEHYRSIKFFPSLQVFDFRSFIEPVPPLLPYPLEALGRIRTKTLVQYLFRRVLRKLPQPLLRLSKPLLFPMRLLVRLVWN